MSYVNVGAYVNNRRPASKKALREALRDAPATVKFDSTALMGPRSGDTIKAEPADIGTYSLSVAGPDPYSRRDWYATVSVKNGKISLA
jgi:hypothetical protein